MLESLGLVSHLPPHCILINLLTNKPFLGLLFRQGTVHNKKTLIEELQTSFIHLLIQQQSEILSLVFHYAKPKTRVPVYARCSVISLSR